MNPTLVVSVVCAVIGALALVIVAKIRKPLTMQELFIENRALRQEVKEQGDRINMIEDRFERRDAERQRTIGLLGAGLDAFRHYLERIRPRWGDGDAMPPFTVTEKSAIDLASAIHPDPLDTSIPDGAA